MQNQIAVREYHVAKACGHCAHPFMAEQGEREEEARQWRKTDLPWSHQPNEEDAPLQFPSWKTKCYSGNTEDSEASVQLHPLLPSLQFSSYILLLSPDGWTEINDFFPFGKSWKHQRFSKRRPGTADSLVTCLVGFVCFFFPGKLITFWSVCWQYSSRVSLWVRDTPWLKIAVCKELCTLSPL